MASFTERLRARGVSDGSPTFTERISKRIEEERAIQARREKLAQYWGTGISSLNNETTAPTQTAPFKKGTSLNEQLTVQNALNTINSPALMPADMAEQALRAKTLVNLSQEPQYKPLLKEPPQQQTTPIINMFDSSTVGGYLANKAISGLYSVAEGLQASQDMLKPQNRVSILGDIWQQRKQDLADRLAQERVELEQAGQDKSGFVRTLGNLTEGATGMIPTMALSGMSGGVMGVPFIMWQAAGNAYTQARREGATHEQALKYGLASGALEGAIEGVIGGMPGMKGIADPLIDTATRGIKSNLLRGAARVGLDAAGEGIEEVLSTAINPYLQRATYKPEAENASAQELAGSFGMGAALSGILGGGQSLINARLNRPTLQQAPIQQQTQQAPIQTQPTVQAQQTQPTTQNQQAQQQAAPTTEAPQQARIFSEEPTGTIPEGMRERGFSQNIRTDAAMNEDIRASFDENPEVYKQLSNQKTLEKAQEIFNKGQAEAEADFYQSISSNSFRPADVPLAKMLAQQAAEQGDIGKARQILSSVAEKLTEAGQFSQAAKILREADPETFLMTMDKQLKKLNEQGRKKYGKKWKDVDLTPGEIDMINKLPRGDTQAYEQAWEQIGQRIANDMHVSGMEKFNTWRRIAMLLNPKTHIRNVGGNVIMMGMRKAADTIGAALQKAFVPAGQRTQSVGWSFNKDIVAKVNESWDTVKKDLLGESRWEVGNLKSLGREKRIFKNPALQWLNEVSLKSLNWEDNVFAERAYKDALGQYLQANNMTEVTSEAIEYAKRRTLEATFKQANMLADFINKAKNVPVAGFFVEGAIPFTQTPANIVMRGIEYSPGGIIKALYDIKAGKTAATVIEDLSKGLTGSAIMALGFWLSSIGWAKVNRKRSDKAEALYQELGDQRYAINTPLGSYTFDWAQPFSIPFAMGIAAQEAIRDRKDGDTIIQAVIDGIAAGGDTIFNMTMLQNIREILGSYGSPTEKIMGIPIDYLEQAIASVLGQTARTIDPVRRSTYDPNSIGQWWRGIRARIPGLSQTLEPALNIWGQEQSQGGALQQFISPGYFRARSDDPVTNEMARLYESVNDNDILPKTAPNNFTKNKVAYTLTPEQKTEFARIMGQKNYNDLARLFTSSEYKALTDEQRAKRVKSIVESNYDEAKGIIIGGAK